MKRFALFVLLLTQIACVLQAVPVKPSTVLTRDLLTESFVRHNVDAPRMLALPSVEMRAREMKADE